MREWLFSVLGCWGGYWILLAWGRASWVVLFGAVFVCAVVCGLLVCVWWLGCYSSIIVVFVFVVIVILVVVYLDFGKAGGVAPQAYSYNMQTCSGAELHLGHSVCMCLLVMKQMKRQTPKPSVTISFVVALCCAWNT